MPTVVILGGVNGAGKTTAARSLLAEQLALTTFVNADVIATGLSGFAPGVAATAAGRVMLKRLAELADDRADFAFEATLAGRTYVTLVKQLRTKGYRVELYYFWLQSPELALDRIRRRVIAGGHDVPEPTVRRRFRRSLVNFWDVYRTLADVWSVHDNSEASQCLVGEGQWSKLQTVHDPERWSMFMEAVADASRRTDD